MGRGRIISFAETTEQIRNRTKDVTRRDWKDSYVDVWEPGDPFQMYDKSPRVGGSKVTDGVITGITTERVDRLIENDMTSPFGVYEMHREGFPGQHPSHLVSLFDDPEQTITRISFDYADDQKSHTEIDDPYYWLQMYFDFIGRDQNHNEYTRKWTQEEPPAGTPRGWLQIALKWLEWYLGRG